MILAKKMLIEDLQYKMFLLNIGLYESCELDEKFTIQNVSIKFRKYFSYEFTYPSFTIQNVSIKFSKYSKYPS